MRSKSRIVAGEIEFGVNAEVVDEVDMCLFLTGFFDDGKRMSSVQQIVIVADIGEGGWRKEGCPPIVFRFGIPREGEEQPKFCRMHVPKEISLNRW